jgi:hypothetical protein
MPFILVPDEIRYRSSQCIGAVPRKLFISRETRRVDQGNCFWETAQRLPHEEHKGLVRAERNMQRTPADFLRRRYKYTKKSISNHYHPFQMPGVITLLEM